MKSKLITNRASLIAAAAYHSTTFACLFVGATVLSSSAIAGDITWDGDTNTDWNDAANWAGGVLPTGSDNAIINVNAAPNFPLISADLTINPNEIKIGTGSGNTAQVNHTAGSVVVGGWSAIGEFGGTGTYNLANTGATGGTLTGFGTGSGSYSAYRLYVCRNGTGDMAVNTSGTVKVFNDMYVGDSGTGTLKWDSGTLDRSGDGGWLVIGQGGASGNGTFNISGGTINAANDTVVGRTSGSTGNLNQAGGAYTTGGFWVGREGATGTWTVSGASTQLTSTGEVYVGGGSGSTGTLQINAGTVALNNWVNVGRDGGDGTLEMTGGSMTVERALRIGFGTNGFGTLTMSGGAKISAGTVSEFVVIGGNQGDGAATVTDSGTSLSSAGEFYVGNDTGSLGQLTVSGGTVSSGSWFGIGRNGSTGTLTINGTGVVNQGTTDSGSRLELTNFSQPTTATLNLDGGTLMTNGIINGANGTCNVFLNGGLVKPTIDNDSFLQGMTSVTIKGGGAKFDTDGKNIAVGQSMVGISGDGGLMKSGLGRLRLNSANTYSGTTTVTDGTFGGSGSITGPLIMQGGTLEPGASFGSFGAGNTTILAATLSCQIDGTASDLLNVTGVLDLSSSSAILNFSSPLATLPTYVIANYTSLVGTFSTVDNLPSGYTLNYGSTQMTITRPLTPYESWLAANFPGETNPTIIGTEADPDGDNQQNNLEFALGGNPNSGSDNAKIYHLTADSSDAGSDNELLITIAIRNGGDGIGMNPVFTPVEGGQSAATQDGIIYAIQGGEDLSFTGTVSAVSTVATGLPAAPTGYEYRTFSLDGSNGLLGKGFMRVKIMP